MFSNRENYHSHYAISGHRNNELNFSYVVRHQQASSFLFLCIRVYCVSTDNILASYMFSTPRFILKMCTCSRLTTGGIRCADHATPSIRKSWHYFANKRVVSCFCVFVSIVLAPKKFWRRIFSAHHDLY
jgi:hypothetical protein